MAVELYAKLVEVRPEGETYYRLLEYVEEGILWWELYRAELLHGEHGPWMPLASGMGKTTIEHELEMLNAEESSTSQ